MTFEYTGPPPSAEDAAEGKRVNYWIGVGMRSAPMTVPVQRAATDPASPEGVLLEGGPTTSFEATNRPPLGVAPCAGEEAA